jgi:nucleoside-diphosphate-sugar epimerase
MRDRFLRVSDLRFARGRVGQLDAKTETEPAKSLVIGGTGLVGGYIVEHLVRRGERPFALSRSPQSGPGVDWLRGDLEKPDTLKFPAFATLYCTADAVLLANALPRLFSPSLRRIVAFSSTSVLTKQDTEVAAERDTIRKLADAERMVAEACGQHNVGWTILRPTLIYTEGRDNNITPLSRLIRRFRFMPLVGGGRVYGNRCMRRIWRSERSPRPRVLPRSTSFIRCLAPRRSLTGK